QGMERSFPTVKRVACTGILAITFFFALFAQAQAEQETNCAGLFRKLSWNYLSASKLSRLRAKDSRFAWNELRKSSETLDGIDNFFSPATQNLIFSETLSKKSIESLQTIVNQRGQLAFLAKKEGVILGEDSVALLD